MTVIKIAKREDLILKRLPMKRLLLFLLVCLFHTSYAQEYWGKLDDFVSYEGEPILVDIYTFDSNDEAIEIIEWILGYVGIPQNFEVSAANVDNAAAIIRTDKRYILYNQEWIKNINDTVQNDWAATSILAHEIGHHLSGHTLGKGGSRPKLELEADEFSGFVLAQMGASLDEAQQAIEHFVTSEEGSSTHPPKSARLAAITNGWIDACNRTKNCQEGGSDFTVSSSTVPIQSVPSAPSSPPVTSASVVPAPSNADGKQPVSRNTDWVPVERDFNGTTMVLVPAGSFSMGSENGELNEKPIHIQRFDSPFWIDKTEVTRGAYEKCVATGACESKSDNKYSNSASQPVNYVSWYEAATYCKWRGVRLPTEREWEYAARGPDNLIYPWGNELDGNRSHHRGNSGNKTASVGNYLSGKSWVGALDMTGNVREWANSLSKDYPYVTNDGREFIESEKIISENITVRGGSFWGISSRQRAADRGEYSADVDYSGGGFRCARS